MRRSVVLLMLHLAYAFVPLGLLATGLAGWGLLPLAVGMHLLGIGAIGGMILAVMMRATMGHTGREVAAGPVLAGAFALVVAATVLRVGAAEASLLGLSGIAWAGGLWTGAFGLFALRAGPWLLRPRLAPRRPDP